MYFDQFNETREHAANSRELAMHAREHGKEMALLAGLYRAHHSGHRSGSINFKALLTGFFTGN